MLNFFDIVIAGLMAFTIVSTFCLYGVLLAYVKRELAKPTAKENGILRAVFGGMNTMPSRRMTFYGNMLYLYMAVGFLNIGMVYSAIAFAAVVALCVPIVILHHFVTKRVSFAMHA